jgi:hypothetical protein
MMLLTQKLSHKFPQFAPTIRVGGLSVTDQQRILNQRICLACGIDGPGLWDASTLERIEDAADLKENDDFCEGK